MSVQTMKHAFKRSGELLQQKERRSFFLKKMSKHVLSLLEFTTIGLWMIRIALFSY